MIEARKGEYLHDAFISYSRKDKAFASLVEKALEDFAPPKDIPVPQRRLDIFRDEDDFTGTEYYASINKHLGTSRKLILICSPAARASRYVNEEIRIFAETNGSGNIIPILLEGVPNNEASPEQTVEMAFPEALVEIMKMPLAVGYRGFNSSKDKVNKGIYDGSWFSILANLYDISRSDIEQREKKRQVRVRNYWIAGIGSVVIALLAFSFWALWELNIANKQRNIAVSRQLVAQSFLNASGNLYHPLLLSLAARRVTQTFETQDSLLRALQHLPRRLSFLWGHKFMVSSVAFSPDGKILASGSQDDTVILWDMATRKPLGAPLAGHQPGAGVTSIAFNPDGKTLASGSQDGTVILTDVTTRKPLGKLLAGDAYRGLSVTFSPDGKTLASGSQDGTVIMWDLSTRKPLGAPLAGHQPGAGVTSVAFSPDNKTFAAGSQDGTVILWNVASHKPLGKALAGHQSDVTSIAFSPDGKILASGSQDDTVILWDMATGKPLGEALAGHQPRLPSFTIGPNGNILVGPQTGLTSIAFSPDGKTLAAGNLDGTVILWDVASRKPLGDVLAGHQSDVTSIAFSPDGKTLAAGNLDGTVILWDIVSRKPLGTRIAEPEYGVRGAVFSPDGKTLASGIRDTVILWDVATRKPLGEPLIGHQSNVTSVAFSSNGKTLASGSEDNSVILWDVATRKPLGEPLSPQSEVTSASAVTSVALNPDGKILVSEMRRIQTVILWDVATRKPLDEPIAGWSATFSPDGKVLALASRNGVILWDVAIRKPLGDPLIGHQSDVTSVAFSSDGKTLASVSEDNSVILWDVGTRKPLDLGTPITGHADSHIGSIALSPNGETLALASTDGVILWDVASRKPLGEALAGWEAHAWHQPGEEGVSSVAFSPDNKTLASVGRDGIILWDLDITAWEKLTCDIVNRNFTHKEWNDYVGDAMAYLPVCPDLAILPE